MLKMDYEFETFDLIVDPGWIQILRMDTNVKGWMQMSLKIYSNVVKGLIQMLRRDYEFDTGWI